MSAGSILIVDDTPENLDLLVEILERCEYEVRVARSGRRALAAAAASPPDLVMLDINMPEMDGYEVCARLKADEETRDVPVIFLSVHDTAVDKVRAFQAGGADYVIKPFQAEEVLARVENQLKIARLQRELTAEREEALKAREEALAASSAKSLFLANMSHELRTPLNGILGYVQLLGRDETLSPAQRQQLEVITRSGEHLLALINDVLSLSKIEAGQTTLNERVFDLRRLLQGLEEMFRLRADGQGLDLVFDVDPGVPRVVTGDDGKLRQILINLLGNAVKFTERGSVSLRARWHEGRATFEVEDTGPGIAPADLERIFEPFVQTESGVRSGEGTGLGLTITRNFVYLMGGGQIHAESEVGRGALFRFDIRLEAASGAAASDDGTAPRMTSPLPPLPAAALGWVAALSPEQRGELQAAAMAGDIEAAYGVADAIVDREGGLADDLRALVRAYRFDDIIDGLDQGPGAGRQASASELD